MVERDREVGVAREGGSGGGWVVRTTTNPQVLSGH